MDYGAPPIPPAASAPVPPVGTVPPPGDAGVSQFVGQPAAVASPSAPTSATPLPAPDTSGASPVSDFGPNNDLRFTQINPTQSPTLQALQGSALGAGQTLAGNAGNVSGLGGLGSSGIQYGADTTAARQAVDTGLQGLQNTPDRQTLAAQALKLPARAHDSPLCLAREPLEIDAR